MPESKFFTENETFAFFGVSSKPSKFGNTLYKHLSENGYTVYAVRARGDDVAGVKTYSSLAELPTPVSAAVLCLPPERAAALIPELRSAGINQVFLQQGCESEAVLAACREQGLQTWYGSCAILNSRPTGLHSIHAFFARLFGGWARELK